MKNYLMLVIVLVFASNVKADLDCSFIGGKIDDVVNAANTTGVVHAINDVTSQMNTLIRLCEGIDEEVPVDINTVDYSSDVNAGIPKGDCDHSTVGRHSENGVKSVQRKIGDANKAAARAKEAADNLTSVLLQCIKH